MKLKLEQLRQAQKKGYEILVRINGEFYDLEVL